MRDDKKLLTKLFEQKLVHVNIDHSNEVMAKQVAYNMAINECLSIVDRYFSGDITSDVLDYLNEAE